MKEKEEIFNAVKIISSEVHSDARGELQQVYNNEIVNLISMGSKQICHTYYSRSRENTIRGLHYQFGVNQDRLISIISGSILDVVLDIRKDSPTFGCHEKIHLDSSSLIWIPTGFAHGFQALTNDTIMLYQCTGAYSQDSERCINVFDRTVNIKWKNKKDTIISDKDLSGIEFNDADYF